MPSLYRRLLGPDFDALPNFLRRFHDVEKEWHGRATFEITRGRGWLRRPIARLVGLPPAGAAVPVRVRVVAEGERERWIRDFGKCRLETVQWAWRGLLLESFAGMTLGFRLVAEGPRLRLEPARAWLLGLPWPRWLAPRVRAVEEGREQDCSVVVRVELPLLGLLVQYEGVVLAEEIGQGA